MVDDVDARAATQPDGLTSAEATARLISCGPNELAEPEPTSIWRPLLQQFKNVLIIVLLSAAFVSGLMGHALEAFVIGLIVLFAVVLGFIQEYRAERALEALRRLSAPVARVVRDGIEVVIPARDVVRGDVLVVRTGDHVAADARLITAIGLGVDESVLTGESRPVTKTVAPYPGPQASQADRIDVIHAGTVVVRGRGRGVVIATGMATEFGAISGLVRSVIPRRTPLQENLDRLGRTLGKASLLVVALIVALGLWRGLPPLEMLLFGIALAVAVVPEALPAVVTISLAIGVRRMVRRNALVRRLPVVETLGATSVICTDKTGTLTKNEMTIREIYAGDRVIDVSGVGYTPSGELVPRSGAGALTSADYELLTAGVLASDAVVRFVDGRWQVVGDPTEGALIVAAMKGGLDPDAINGRFPRASEIAFTSERRRMTTVNRMRGDTIAYSKGAPDVILSSCDRELESDHEVLLTRVRREVITGIEHRMAKQGLRVLALARKRVTKASEAEHGMTFLGLVGMLDPPRPEVAAAIRVCADAGITPVMITGDHPVTARVIADELGLDAGRVVTGRELDAMTDEALAREVEGIRIYARVSPAHKLRVVDAWQQRGAVVAMTGDGVNDAPALKKADVGIAMGISGTDVSKEASAMILVDDNFATIVAAVEEGRVVFGNVRKYLTYLLASNVGEIALMAGAAIGGLPLPLTAVQILYVNLATDGLPALALAIDPCEDGVMHRAPRNPRRGIFTTPLIVLLLVGGLWSGLVNLTLFAGLLSQQVAVERAMTVTFVTLVLIQFFTAYSYRSERAAILHRPFTNRWLNYAVAWEIVLLVAVIYVPLAQLAFGTFAMGATHWLMALAGAMSIVPVLETGKWLTRRAWPREVP
jgi:Ca2+-transporting ATPase